MTRWTTSLADIAVGLFAGIAATAASGVVQEALYRSTPKRIKRQEERVRRAPSSQVAAETIAASLGRPLEEHARGSAGVALHYGVGAAWGTVYTLLRRRGARPLAAGLAAGASLALIVDEGLAPALGFSAPNRAFPALTHVRGFANHLAYGAAAALTAEAVYALTGTTPGRYPARSGAR